MSNIQPQPQPKSATQSELAPQEDVKNPHDPLSDGDSDMNIAEFQQSAGNGGQQFKPLKIGLLSRITASIFDPITTPITTPIRKKMDAWSLKYPGWQLRCQYTAMFLIQLAGFVAFWYFKQSPDKIIVSILLTSAACQVVLDFVPSTIPSRKLMSALCRLAPIIVGGATLLG